MEMRNNNGFTFIELLGTIVILGILSTIAVVGVGNVLNSGHDKYYNKQLKQLELAGQEYFTDHKESLPTVNNASNIVYLNELISENYINKIVDYKKKVCSTTDSYVTVKRISSSKYQYSGYLSCGTKQVGKKYSNSEINNFNIYLDYLSGANNIESKLYTNNNASFNLVIKSNEGLSGYKYVLYKSGKEYMKSEVIPATTSNSQVIQDTITISKDGCSDGEYYIGIIAIDYNGHEKKVYPFTDKKVILDTKKPTCNIKLPSGGLVNGWYNKSASKATISFSDEYLYQYNFRNSETSFPNYSTTKPSELKLYETDYNGGYLYGYVKDKAGNEGVCKSNNFKADFTNPSCDKVSKSGGVSGSNGWYKKGTNSSNPVTVTGTCNDSNSGCDSSNNLVIGKFYSEGKNTGTIDIYDNAGNKGQCSASVYIDTVLPDCSIKKSGGTLGNNNWYKRGTNSSNPVTVTSTCFDNNSQCVSDTQIVGTYYEDSNFNITGNVYDKAGNTSSCSTEVKIDTTLPQCYLTKNNSSTFDNNKWYLNPVTITNNCGDSLSGCNSNSIYHQYNGNYTDTFECSDYAGNYNNPLSTTTLIDNSKPTIEITDNPSSDDWYSAKVNGSFRMNVKITGIGPSGATLFGKWEKEDSDYSKIMTIYSDYTYTTDAFSSQHNDYRFYKVVTGAGRESSSSTRVMIDNAPPSINWCTRGSSTATYDCGTGKYHYIVAGHVTDNGRYTTGYFKWEGGENWPTDSRSGNYKECIGSSTTLENQSIKYKLCDSAGNCTSEITKKDFSNENSCPDSDLK